MTRRKAARFRITWMVAIWMVVVLAGVGVEAHALPVDAVDISGRAYEKGVLKEIEGADEETVIDGSTNWTSNALFENYESAEILKGKEFAKIKLGLFEELKKAVVVVEPDKKSFWKR